MFTGGSLGGLTTGDKQPASHLSPLRTVSEFTMKQLVWAVCLLTAAAALPVPVSAQGLLWAVPDVEGRWVRYEGTYTQVIKRPNDPTGDLKLSWTRHLTIKALQAEAGVVNGQTVACRWVELKVITGPVKEGIIDAGPGGIRLYKILVPVELIRRVQITEDQTVLDANLVVATHVPIAKGYRKIGNESATPLETNVFQIFPALTVLQHYRQLSLIGTEDIPLRNETVPAHHYRGEQVSEDAFTRSTNVADLWRSDSPSVPFGVVKWQVQLTVERKDSTEPRSAFTPLSEITEEMSTAEIGDAAESELVLD
jgi:hypothetical protein